jgi:hypothetical protein
MYTRRAPVGPLNGERSSHANTKASRLNHSERSNASLRESAFNSSLTAYVDL